MILHSIFPRSYSSQLTHFQDSVFPKSLFPAELYIPGAPYSKAPPSPESYSVHKPLIPLRLPECVCLWAVCSVWCSTTALSRSPSQERRTRFSRSAPEVSKAAQKWRNRVMRGPNWKGQRSRFDLVPHTGRPGWREVCLPR